MANLSLAEGIDLLRRRGLILRIMLGAGLILSIAVLAGQAAELNGLVSLESAELSRSELAYSGALLAYILLLFATYVVFGMWIHRAAANIVAARVPGFRFSPAWAVGWHFVPIANLFKPYGAMRQIDNASQGGEGEALDRGNMLLRSWWAVWLALGIANNISFRLSLGADTPEKVRASLEADTLATALGLILYPLAYLLVTRVTRAQAKRLTAAHIFD